MLCKDPKKQKFKPEPIQPIQKYESKEYEYVEFDENDYDLKGYNGPEIRIIETDPPLIHKSYLKFLKRKPFVIKERSYEDQFDPFIIDYDNF